jgi:hypothetical protein
MDYYPEVVRQLQAAGCQFVTHIRPGVEGWNSPRTGYFVVDNPIRSKANGNRILQRAGLAPALK